MLATLEPPRVSLWHREPKPEDSLQVGVYSAALKAILLLGQGWTRNQPRCEIDTYEPLNVARYLRNWEQLASLAESTSSPGAEPIGTAGEVDARRTLISIKADLEQGTDHGLYTILNWRMAEKIYRRQGRQARYDQRYATFRATWREDFTPEPWAPLAEAACIERIARCCGWFPHANCENP